MSTSASALRRTAVAIGGSSGSYEALGEILKQLPAQCPLALMLVVHQHRHGTRDLSTVLQRHCRLPVHTVNDGVAVGPGAVWVCPANYHLLVEEHRAFSLSTDAPVNHSRPSIDVFFESAARVYREQLVGVLLSGASHDGAQGLKRIAECGGLTACQDPSTAAHPVMPQAAREATDVNWVCAPRELGVRLAGLSHERF